MNLINAYQLNENELFADELLQFPSNCPFGNLDIKYILMMTRLNMLNETIKQIHELHEASFDARQKKEYVGNTPYKVIVLTSRFSCEIKIIADEMFCLNYILEEYRKTGSWIKKIKADRIGVQYWEKDTIGFEAFNSNPQLMKDMNGMANAVKHSFVNSEALWIRNIERIPKLIAFHNPHNDLEKGLTPYIIKLPDFVESFNKFLNEYRKHMKVHYGA